MEVLLDDIIDTHIHLSEHYKGGLQNAWHPNDAEGFRRDACLLTSRRSLGDCFLTMLITYDTAWYDQSN